MASVESREDPAPTAKRAAIQASVLAATEALLAEGASYADLNIERIATRAGHLAHGVLLLLPRQARAAHAPHRGGQRAALPAGRHLVLGRRRARARDARGAHQHRRALRRARRPAARHRRGLDLRRGGRAVLARDARALRRREPPAHRGRARGRPRGGRARAGDVVRAVLDDRAHHVPAPGPGRALRRAPRWSTRWSASGCARSTARSCSRPPSRRGTACRRSSPARRPARPAARGRARRDARGR